MSLLNIFLLFTVLFTPLIESENCEGSLLSTGGKYLLADESTKVIVENERNCQVTLRLLAVGGGGDGDAFSGNAGGSGLVIYKEVSIPSGSILSIEIGSDGNFGTAGEATMVSDLLSGETLILADGGEGGSDDETSGGGGYSGGGGGSITGYPGGDGGSDGADGEHSPFSSDGGPGSGLDISELQFEYFTVSPGAGGVGEYNRGGGGGGLLVISRMTGMIHGQHRVGQGVTDGQGYGAGSGNGWGEKGLILLEIVED